MALPGMDLAARIWAVAPSSIVLSVMQSFVGSAFLMHPVPKGFTAGTDQLSYSVKIWNLVAKHGFSAASFHRIRV